METLKFEIRTFDRVLHGYAADFNKTAHLYHYYTVVNLVVVSPAFLYWTNISKFKNSIRNLIKLGVHSVPLPNPSVLS